MLSSPSHPRTRKAAWPLLLLTVLALVLGGLSLPAAAATPADVAGAVTGRNGAAVPGVSVRLGTLNGSTFSPIAGAQATTAADGTWKTVVPDDMQAYVVQYSSSAYDLAYLAAAGATTTTPGEALELTGGSSGVAAQLVKGSAEVAGKVTRAGSLDGDALEDVTVKLYEGDKTLSEATTGADGTFTIDDVVPGSYVVQFSRADHTTTYYKAGGESTKDRAQASTLTVSAGQKSSGVDGSVADLVKSQVGGIVRTTAGAPISGAEIRFYTRNAADAGTGTVTYTPALGTGPAAGTTGSAGTWKVERDFAPYVVEVRAPAYGTFYYKGSSIVSDPAAAEEVQVKEGVARRLDAALGNASTTTISGKLTSAETGQPVQGVTISVETGATDASGKTVWTEVQTTKAKTDPSGSYSADVPPSDDKVYVVGFHAPGFETQYYNDKPTQAAADKVKATFEKPLKNVNATLTRVAQVIGTVRDNAGNPLQGVRVTPVVYDSGTDQWIPKPGYAAATTTDKAGQYAITVENAGLGKKFRLQFEQAGRETRWFPAATVADEGQNLSVTEHEVLSGRDATLPTLAVLAGSVTESDGAAYDDGGEVSLWRRVSYTENGELGGASHTEWRQVAQPVDLSPSGGFSFSVPSGSYRLLAELAGNNQGFLPGLVGLDQAPDITLAPEQRSTLQKYALPGVSAIRGQVTTTTGAPARGEQVHGVYRYVTDIVDGAPVLSGWRSAAPSATTQGDGSYELRLRARTYRVGVPTKGFYAVDGSSPRTVDDADDVPLGSASVTGVDIGLDDGRPVNLAAPWIAGQAVEGGKLTAHPGTWSAQDVTYTYQWFHAVSPGSGFDPITGANKETYTIPSGSSAPIVSPYDGKHYLVRVTAKRATGDVSQHVDSKPTSKAKASPFYAPADPPTENRQDPQVTGRAIVGETLTGTTGEWSKGGTFALQWLADGQVVPGATTSTLVLDAAQLGKRISLKVTETSNDPDVVVVSAATSEVVRGTLRATTLPSVKGQPFVGKPLSAEPGTWNAAKPTFTYQWLVDGRAVPGATGTTYTPSGADEGKTVAVRVGASVAKGMDPGSATSESTALVAPDPTTVSNRTAPKVSGTPRVGETLSSTEGTWTNEPTSFSYQWLVGGVAITGATRPTYELERSTAGKVVTVRVTASKAGLTSGTATSDPVGPIASGPITNTTLPVVTGTAAPGGTLSASTGTWDPADGLTYDYQWLADGTPVAGATSSSIVVTESLVGKAVAVVVTARRGADSASATSQPRTIAEQPVQPVEVVVAPTVEGRAVVGEELVVDTGTSDPVDATRAVQWLRDGAPLSGAIGERYRATRADAGTVLSARVTYIHADRADTVRTVSAGRVADPAGTPEKPELQVVERTKGSKLVVKVKVFAEAVSPVPGRVVLKENGRTLGAEKLTGGTRKIVVRGLSRGKHVVRVKFLSASEDVLDAKRTIRVRIR